MVAQLPAVASQEEQMPDKQQRVLEYEAAGASDQGRTRKSNEDSYGLDLRNEEGSCNFVVCDGMGGAAAGEVASRMAVEAMLRAMDQKALTRETFQHAVDAVYRFPDVLEDQDRPFEVHGIWGSMQRGNEGQISSGQTASRLAGSQYTPVRHNPA